MSEDEVLKMSLACSCTVSFPPQNPLYRERFTELPGSMMRQLLSSPRVEVSISIFSWKSFGKLNVLFHWKKQIGLLRFLDPSGVSITNHCWLYMAANCGDHIPIVGDADKVALNLSTLGTLV